MNIFEVKGIVHFLLIEVNLVDREIIGEDHSIKKSKFSFPYPASLIICCKMTYERFIFNLLSR
jgi:hypothetical protein